MPARPSSYASSSCLGGSCSEQCADGQLAAQDLFEENTRRPNLQRNSVEPDELELLLGRGRFDGAGSGLDLDGAQRV